MRDIAEILQETSKFVAFAAFSQLAFSRKKNDDKTIHKGAHEVTPTISFATFVMTCTLYISTLADTVVKVEPQKRYNIRHARTV